MRVRPTSFPSRLLGARPVGGLLVGGLLVGALLSVGCEGTLIIEGPDDDGERPPPRLMLDDGGPPPPSVDAGVAPPPPSCDLPAQGECDGDTARWCDGDTEREEQCAEGCELLGALGRHGCASAPPPPPPPSPCAGPEEAEVIALANEARGSAPALTCDEDMARTARKHSQDMCDQGYFSHTSLDGRSPFDRMRDEGVSFRTAGENIARGQRTPASVHSSWMNSSGHRANILNGAYGRIGVGYVACGGSPLWTQVFAD